MADATTYLKNELADHVFRNAAYTSPTTVYLALFTTATDDAGGGTEVAGGSYARQSVTFGAPTDGAVSNTGTVTFTNLPTATITHWAIFDAVSAGNMLVHDAFGSPINATAGDDQPFAVGDIDMSVA